ncbi:MAG: bifunctional 5,10-methylenetetrahydrofolate dehydrogenase/5,10-methenyltetrahydrofolate cyclohydrolase [Gaiellaceae bacterium]
MSATLMDGKALAGRVRERVAAAVASIGHVALATVLVGDDPASDVYVGHKHRACQEVGIESIDRRLPAATSQEEVLALVRELSADENVDGLLVQTPLPPHLDEPTITWAVDPVKDVDGFNPENVGRLWLGREGHVGATPRGIMELLREYEVELEGVRAVIVGRSEIVGKPMAALLLAANATVTMCHSRTRDLGQRIAEADVLVAAVGVARLVKPEMVKPGAVVIDVGITRTPEGLAGDVDPDVAERARLLTPVPGGVGPMTVAMLLENTVLAARWRQKPLALR